MNTEMLVLRLLHIFTGVFWAGAVFYMAFFVLPAIKALGPEGGKFMQQLTRTKNMPVVLSLSGLISVLAGFRLLQLASGNFEGFWFQSNMGMALTIGSSFALLGLLIG